MASARTLEPKQYFSQASDAFENAMASSSDIRRYYRVGNKVICLRFAGDALVPLLAPALAHIETGMTAKPSLTILCWDSDSTRTPLPPAPWPNEHRRKGYIPWYDANIMRASFETGVNILNLFDPAHDVGIYWVQNRKVIPYWERSFPFRGIFHWWCRSRPFQMIHAGAVGTKNGGVLLTGKGGAGKSTTALACLTSPLSYAGDDYVMINNEPEPYVYSIYSTGKLVPEYVDMLPHLADKISNPQSLGSEKALLFLNDHYPEKLSAGFPIKAVFQPRVTHEPHSRLRPATATESLLAMAPSTMHDLVSDRDQSFRKMSALVQSVPNYWLDLGTDLAEVSHIITDFLDKN